MTKKSIIIKGDFLPEPKTEYLCVSEGPFTGRDVGCLCAPYVPGFDYGVVPYFGVPVSVPTHLFRQAIQDGE